MKLRNPLDDNYSWSGNAGEDGLDDPLAAFGLFAPMEEAEIPGDAPPWGHNYYHRRAAMGAR